MSITVNKLISDALLELGVIRENQTISAEQLADGIRKLNQMMSMWENDDNIDLGYYPMSSGASTVPITEESEWAVTVNLAVVLAGSYGAPLQPSTISEASRTKTRLDRVASTLVEASMDHLPVGRRAHYNINTDE